MTTEMHRHVANIEPPSRCPLHEHFCLLLLLLQPLQHICPVTEQDGGTARKRAPRSLTEVLEAHASKPGVNCRCDGAGRAMQLHLLRGYHPLQAQRRLCNRRYGWLNCRLSWRVELDKHVDKNPCGKHLTERRGLLMGWGNVWAFNCCGRGAGW
jgi:hypothetical protein